MNNFALEIVQCFEICCEIAAGKRIIQEYPFKELEECFPKKIFSSTYVLSSHEEQGVENSSNQLESIKFSLFFKIIFLQFFWFQQHFL